MNIECFKNREMKLTFREEGEKVLHFEVMEFCKFVIRKFLLKIIFFWSPFLNLFIYFQGIDVYFIISFPIT
jgi:hypothetical protein